MELSQSQQFNEYELHEACFNSRGKPRLRIARSFFQELTQENLPFLIEVFRCWQQYDEYLLIEKEHIHTGEKQYKAVKCSKRGNDVHSRRVERNLAFLRLHENLEFFKPKDFDTEQVVKTRLLWVTLSWDSKLCSLQEALDTCEPLYNLWITNLRNKYGHIDVMKNPDIFPDPNGEAYGYPHYHMILLFRDHEFTVFPWLKEDLSFEYRIHEKDELVKQGKWHSWVDVKAINSMQGIHNYAVKHFLNSQFGDSDSALLNNSIMWLMKKKSYTISGDFRKTYHDLIMSLRSSKVFQLTLDGDSIPIWSCRLIGVYSFAELSKIKEFSVPPPWFIDFDGDEIEELFDVRYRR
jgi:hypothetical protein